MINDEKRREVAKRMREYDVYEFRESAIVPFLECLGHGYVNWRGILDELADLIDRPTCTITCECDAYSSFGERIDGMRLYELSCGHQAVGFEKPEYCPKCGAAIHNG